MSFIVPFITK